MTAEIAPGCLLTEGNCWDVMRALPDDCFDHTISDPPYSDVTHDGARTGPADRLITTFAGITEAQFLELCHQSVRLTRRWVVMFCDWRHLTAVRNVPEFVRFGVWVRPDAAPQFSGDRPGTGWDAVCILHRKGRKRWNGGGSHAVWTHNAERGAHPTQKPLPLVCQLVRQFTDPGELIFDPFAGSGTTGEACARMGRRSHLVELNPDYCQLIRRRMSQKFPPPPLVDGKTGADILVEMPPNPPGFKKYHPKPKETR